MMRLLTRNLILTGITAVSLILVAVGVHAQQRGRGGPMSYNQAAGMGGGHMGMHGNRHGNMDVMRMAERLDLTDEQRDRIGKIIDETRPRLRENGFAMMDNRKELHELMQEGKVNDKKLRSLTSKQGDLVADMMYTQLKVRSDIRAVLTDEQREKMQHRDKFRNRHFKRDMPMPGPDVEDDD